MHAQIQNIANILYDRGVRNVIISPGSRNAPLTLAFVAHKGFSIEMIYDERSAGFIALGKALATVNPSVIICTSGTASVNFYPAICEAFYQEIPLLVLTADRPPEWIDQGDGQSIRQQNLFDNHVLKSYQLLPDYSSTGSYNKLIQTVNEALTLAENTFHRGPVHLNLPFREPFYPNQKTEDLSYRIIEKYQPKTKKLDKATKDTLQVELRHYKRILVFKGQEISDTKLTKYCHKVAISKDVFGAACNTDGFITMHDFLFNKEENLPDLVITMGKNILSKPLKTSFRNANLVHWHIGTESTVPDVFNKLTRHISCTPQQFFISVNFEESTYRDELYQQELVLRGKSGNYLAQKTWTEFTALQQIINKLPRKCNLHIGNSMPVRYLNHIQYDLKQHSVYGNRGTSGIDGSISTAVGIASVIDEEHYVITGDLSFFYDRNGLWNGIDKANINIILLNNNGGGIFDIIKGPSDQQLIDKIYFTTPQNLNAKNTAKDFKMDYFRASNTLDLEICLKEFVKNRCKYGQILEVTTQMEANTNFYKEYLKEMKR
jgi:2-succinyl-5-enolpyruvyl-6-hydroxy-3-cyclohexene-1-carboxylate synthase